MEVSVRMACPSCKKRRPSSKAPASKNICDYISNA
nr:MAG TPA: TFIIB zinc-binding [Caudoviricetes sp.]